MKKIGEYYSVNNQEDEDGYTIYSYNNVIEENITRKQQIMTHSNTLKKQLVFTKRRSRNFFVVRHQILK
jgi:uncharacterized protein YjcR